MITTVSAGNNLVYLLIFMWVAAFATAFMNAGPSTIFFIPIAMSSHFAGMNDIMWWALSLGVLAGSSATLTGATSGVVTQNMLEEKKGLFVDHEERLSFAEYSKRGVPVAMMFLLISSLYIMFLYSIPGLR